MLGRWPFGPGYMPRGGTVSDSILYVKAGGGIYIFNVSNPMAIEKLSEIQTPGSPFYLYRHDDLLCVGEYTAGVALYRISDPVKPQFLSRYMTPDLACGVMFDGRYAYVACWDSGLRIIDFADPLHPCEVGSCICPGQALDVDVEGEFAYLTTGWEGLRIINIYDPANPYEVGSYVRSNDPAREVCVRDTLAYVIFEDIGGLVILNVRDPSCPSEVSVTYPGGEPLQLALYGGLACLNVLGPSRPMIKILDVSQPADPQIVGEFSGTWLDDFSGVATIGERCYTVKNASAPSASVLSLDISDPTHPTLLSTYPMPVSTDAIIVRDSLAIAGTRGRGLQVFDITSHRRIRFLGHAGDTSRVGGLACLGSYVYLACWHGTYFKVVDFSDPTHPAVVGEIDSFGYAHDVAVQEEYAFVSEGEKLRVIDLREPTRPFQVASVRLPSSAFGVDVLGDYCYVANWYGGVQILDISDPVHPSIIGSLATPGAAASDTRVCYPYLYYTDISGFGIADISNPREPVQVGYYQFKPPASAWGIDAHHNLVFVALGYGGMRVFDVSDPMQPTEVGHYITPCWAYHLQYRDDIVYVADCDGFCILQYYGAGISESAPVTYMPSSNIRITASLLRNLLSIKYTCTHGSQSAVTIYDACGRVIMRLYSKDSTPGLKQLNIDVSGLSNGIYFLNLKSDGRTWVARFEVMR